MPRPAIDLLRIQCEKLLGDWFHIFRDMALYRRHQRLGLIGHGQFEKVAFTGRHNSPCLLLSRCIKAAKVCSKDIEVGQL